MLQGNGCFNRGVGMFGHVAKGIEYRKNRIALKLCDNATIAFDDRGCLCEIGIQNGYDPLWGDAFAKRCKAD